ncbi:MULTISPECIES: GUN4 domain-containing protein [Cyanophyceae]|uniref:GUN4 domain-containing protein n=1 Tax=Cyanophyceae TaxID=3028117 RepID=UPI00168A0F9A|nr:GUN4 domain-containing protein [Trichocoleus sp. FACHB-69]MBD1833300.1 GUN4 domain-containing protein [Cyanobacteria bacterium FACHB-472]MBD1930306.1 GUN4 domain-containing protein [Trichocoleus sp. FACHB-69]
MARNWAIAIGINQYNPNNFAPLRYARLDAERIRDFFQEARFDEVYWFGENAPDIRLPNGTTIPTYPSYGNLLSFLEDRFDRPFLAAGDNCWFFFAGHGMQHANRDYLMPIDANPRNVERTAIPVSYVRERLSRCGADNVILMLDACRNEGSRDGAGVGRETQPGIISISACSPTERSWEIEELQQGAFTYALLEALRLGGERSCATVERLSNYLHDRVPELCQRYKRFPEQHPRISADPSEKHHFILIPQYAWDQDIAKLRELAFQEAFINRNLILAEQLCIRANAAAFGADLQVMKLYNRIKELQAESSQSPSVATPTVTPASPLENRSTSNESASAPVSKPVRPIQPVFSDQERTDTLNTPNITRQQFLKWFFWGGTGVAVVTGVGLLNQQPNSEPPSPPDSPTPSLATSSPPVAPPSRTADYSKLENFLKAQQWRYADQETLNIMLRKTGREQQDWLDTASINRLHCDVLTAIDRLWMQYSDRKFGFSVQQQIWQEMGSPNGLNIRWPEFADRVGWRKDGVWVKSNSLPPSLDSSPVGNAPVWMVIFSRGPGWEGWSSLAQRVVECV